MEQAIKTPENEMVINVKYGMVLFMVALKDQTLYPEINTIRRTSTARIRQWLDAFLAVEKNLRLTVKKNCLIHQDEVVYLDCANEQKALIFPLFRDGVKWFEFQEGLTHQELDTFISLLNRFRVLKDDPEDDLVTAMWEADFTNLKYKTSDNFWGEDDDSEIVPWKVREILYGEQTEAEIGAARDAPQGKSISDLFDEIVIPENQIPQLNALERDFKNFSWKLTLEETDYIQDMISQDQHQNTIYDNLEIILIMLRGIEREQDIGPIVEFMTESVMNLLTRGEIILTREYLEKLKPLTDPGKPWLNTLASEFHKRLASAEVVRLLTQVSPPETTASTAFYNELYRLLLLLIPEVVFALAPLLGEIKNPNLEKILLTAIAVKAGQVSQTSMPVANALTKLAPKSLVELTSLIRGHRLPWPTGFLERLSHHEEANIRETALLIILEQDPANIGKLAHMIDDSHTGINIIICAQLSKTRNDFAEKTVRNYLGDLFYHGKPRNETHLMNCYRALGYCASAQVVPFLQNILLKNGWRTVIGRGGVLHRQGAALALMLLPETWGAAEVLKKASRSPFKAIRQAYQQAAQEFRGGADNA